MARNKTDIDNQNHSYHAKRPYWLLTRGNIIWAVVVMVLAGVAIGLHVRANHYQKLDEVAARQAKTWQDKVDYLTSKNARTIYLPKSGDIKMTDEQENSVQFLSQFFAQITDFSSQTGYNTNYDLAKSSGIHDPAFWNKFMEKPYDKNGAGIVDAENIKMKNVYATGDYLGMNSENIYVDHLDLVGNYVFDGAKNVEVHNSRLVSKDAFWNCENVTIYDSKISGEYLAWNTKNITFINCTIESDQGLCYVDHLTIKNCRALRTDLAFELCTNIDAELKGTIMSIKNPISGKITVDHADEIIMDNPKIDPSKIQIIQRK